MLDQERCILCTRCVRFLDEVTGTGELGIFNRSDHSEIDLFPARRLDNEYSGNVVDICPVGALTAKEFRFKARVWYLEYTPSVCPTCATGCNIDVHHRRGQIHRFRPRENQDVNRYWLCDEGRFSYAASQSERRVLSPFLRRQDQLHRASWTAVLADAAEHLGAVRAAHGPGAVAGIVSARATNEEAHVFRRLVGDSLGGGVYGLSWSPPGATGDDFLRDADKNPNSRGLRALGIEVDGLEDLSRRIDAGEVKALVVLRADLGAALGEPRLRALADKLEYLLVADSDGHAAASLADAVLPLASFAEMDGTFTNRKGRVQRIHQAFPPAGAAVPGWKVLSDLGGQAAHWEGYASAAAVFNDLAAASPPFAGLSYDAVGSLGAPLRDA
jgi:NADH-quinone oxidoreductase subunit G